jgi:hypothetical protein
MDSAIFKEGFYQGKLVECILQFPADGSLVQYDMCWVSISPDYTLNGDSMRKKKKLKG